MAPGLRPWQRLSVRLAGLFVAVTPIAVCVVGLPADGHPGASWTTPSGCRS